MQKLLTFSLLFFVFTLLAQEDIQEVDKSSTGYEGVFEIGYVNGNEVEGNIDFVKLNIVNGQRFNKRLYIGIGTGLRLSRMDQYRLVPLYIYPKLTFGERDIAIFVAGGFGFSFNLDNKLETEGYLLAFPTCGVSFKFSKRLALLISLNYDVNQVKTGYTLGQVNTSELKGIGVNVGLSF